MERQRLVSEAEAAAAVSIAAALFFNTALVFVIVFAEVEPIRRAIGAAVKPALALPQVQQALAAFYQYVEAEAEYTEEVTQDLVALFPLAGPYTGFGFRDLSPRWYASVGVVLISSILAQVVLPLLPLASGIMNRCGLACWWSPASSTLSFTKSCPRLLLRAPHTKRSMARCTEAPSFELGTRYGLLLHLVFTALLLTPGLPIVWLVAGLLLFATYIIDKCVLLRFSRTPLKYTASISDSCLAYFKYAAILHMAVSVWTFSATTDAQTGGKSSALMFPRLEALFGLQPVFAGTPANCSALANASACWAVNGDCMWRDPLPVPRRHLLQPLAVPHGKGGGRVEIKPHQNRRLLVTDDPSVADASKATNSSIAASNRLNFTTAFSVTGLCTPRPDTSTTNTSTRTSLTANSFNISIGNSTWSAVNVSRTDVIVNASDAIVNASEALVNASEAVVDSGKIENNATEATTSTHSNTSNGASTAAVAATTFTAASGKHRHRILKRLFHLTTSDSKLHKVTLQNLCRLPGSDGLKLVCSSA